MTTETVEPKVGMLFEHARHLDMTWQPDPAKGECYADAPHAVYRVTKITGTGVYYNAPGSIGAGWWVGKSRFAAIVGRVVLDHRVTAP